MPRPTLTALAVALTLTPLVALGYAADPFADGYQAGYRAALEEVRKALAEGRTVESALTVDASPTPAAPHPVTDAADATATAAADTTTAAAAAAEPRDWWNHSSLRYPLSDRWRHGLQAQLAFTSLSGNDEGTVWRGSGSLNSRLGRWTNEVTLTLDKRDIKSADGGVNRRDYRMLQESLRYDLTDRWYAAGGFILERDDVALVDRRITSLLGAGYYWLDDERFRLNTYLALGKVDERYMAYVRDHVDVNQRDSALLYFYQTFSWQLSENFSLRQGYRLMRDLERSGRYVFDPVNSIPPGPQHPQGFERYRADAWVKRYRTVAAIDLDYKLSPRSSASIGIEQRYDSNPWPDVVRRDTVRRINFNVMF